jgi:hypothetical protein
MLEATISAITREISDLLEQQTKSVSEESFVELTDEQLSAYEERRERVAILGSRLSAQLNLL